ncbi:hypothetical protein SUGI_0954940 [Cryptomeria japonica]|uniref:uncharacterized protein LOC131051300 n=1 Tax=Cryptomeria japonica TaxID=3369 RepID=UPI002414C6F9|nr:uncharacterized protein LOC131051300 [Cryptomeria japonica]GLJ45367.1 hypothetical protein SUGI_0954940 [Cryptomeria japonica]
MMMNRFDLGGCCLARYGTATPYFASKTDQIMSRYRPIAPKPAAQSTGGVVEAALQTPVESSKVRTCNRSRKRSWDAANGGLANSASPRGQKRAARLRCHVSEAPEQSNASVPLSTVCHSQSFSHGHGHCPQSDTSEDGISALCEIADSADTNGAVSLNFGLRPLTYSCISFEALKSKESPPLEKDIAFMERAAASASPAVNLCGLMTSEVRGRALDQAPLHRQKQEIVTLPLLPSCKAASATSSTETLGGRRIQSPLEDDSQPELSLFDKTTLSRCPCPCPGPCPGLVVDISVVEQLYSACSDPLILTDDSYSYRVIWYNPAYNRLLSLSASELGVLKPLAAFNLDGKPSTGILWGFASKFPGPDHHRVIMPQPLRPVGSSVVVECITDTNLQEGLSSKSLSLEEVEEHLESKTSPCFISDSQKTVRWANSAYKQMVGQPECLWLEKESSNKVARIQGKVLLLFNLQLPQGVSAFSCRVKIQWTNAGDKTSITVPCDVFRINGNASSHSLAWHFDIQAALCL